jgi:hypothetical protein
MTSKSTTIYKGEEEGVETSEDEAFLLLALIVHGSSLICALTICCVYVCNLCCLIVVVLVADDGLALCSLGA